MQVLFVGLSPELLHSTQFPERLTTIRQGGNIPGSPWDAAFVRWEEGSDQAIGKTMDGSVHGLRHGARIGLGATPPAPADTALMVEALARFDRVPAVRRTRDDAVMVITESRASGQHDLVGLRRCLNQLQRHVDQVEAVAMDVKDDVASRRLLDGTSIKEKLGALGDMDRHGYVACIKTALQGKTGRDEPVDLEALRDQHGHASRSVSELVARLRHFRLQAADVFAGCADDDWLRVGPGPDGTAATVAEMVRRWAREEAAEIETLRRWV